MRKSISLILLTISIISLSQFANVKAFDTVPVYVSFEGLDPVDELPNNAILIECNDTKIGAERSLEWTSGNVLHLKIYFLYYRSRSLIYDNEILITETCTLRNLIEWDLYSIYTYNSEVRVVLETFQLNSWNSEGYKYFYIPKNYKSSDDNEFHQFMLTLNTFNPLHDLMPSIRLYNDSFTYNTVFDRYIYILTQSYYTMFNINLYKADGLGVSSDSVKIFSNVTEYYAYQTYRTQFLNGQGFCLNTAPFVEIIIYDYFNGLIYNTTHKVINAGKISNLNIYLPIYDVNILINSSSVGYLEIWRDDLIDYLVRIPTENIDTLPFILLGNHEYTFKFYVNDVLVKTKTIEINETRFIEFGYWTIQSTLAPEAPLPEINYSALIFIFALYAILVVIISLPEKSKNRIPKFKF